MGSTFTDHGAEGRGTGAGVSVGGDGVGEGCGGAAAPCVAVPAAWIDPQSWAYHGAVASSDLGEGTALGLGVGPIVMYGISPGRT